MLLQNLIIDRKTKKVFDINKEKIEVYKMKPLDKNKEDSIKDLTLIEQTNFFGGESDDSL